MAKVGTESGGPVVPPRDMDVGAELNNIYHRTMVETGGDIEASKRAKQLAGASVSQFAALLDQAADGGRGAADALKKALDTLGDGASSLSSWIHAHVDESVIREAGLDPAEVAKAAGVEVEEADVEQAGRDYKDFTGEGNAVAQRDDPGQGMSVGDFSAPRRV